MSTNIKKLPAFNRNWGWLFGLGIFFIFLGFIGFGMVIGLTLMSIFILGVLFEIAGIAQFVDALRSRGWQASVWHATIAFFYMILGGFIIFDPVLASSIITLFIAWTLIVIGISRFIMALSFRIHTHGYFFLLIGSIASTVLGILILSQWPSSGLWVIGLFISIELLIAGWSYIFLAIAIRNQIGRPSH